VERVNALLVTTLNATDFMVFDEWALDSYRVSAHPVDQRRFNHAIRGRLGHLKQFRFAFMEILVSGYGLGGAFGFLR
jgi:hypothetical protein